MDGLTRARSSQGFIDGEEYERYVLGHIMACSAKPARKPKDAPKAPSTFLKKTAVPVNPVTSAGAPSQRKSESGNQYPNMVAIKSTTSTKGATPSKLAMETTIPLSGESKLTSPPGLKSSESSTIASEPSESSSKDEKKKKVVIAPDHFLAQTWWREPAKRRKRVIPTRQFDLRQCLVVDEGGGNNQNGTRGSSRLKKQSNTTLKFCCPICRRMLTESMLGSMTEEGMGKHVAKCTKRMFERGITLSDLKGQGPSPAFLLSPTENEHPEQSYRQELSEAEKLRQQELTENRASRMQSILSARRKSKASLLRLMLE